MRKTLSSEALKKAQRKYKTSERGREMARRWRSTPEQRERTRLQVARLRAARRAAGLTNEGKPRQRERLDGMTEAEKKARKAEQRRQQRAAKKGAK
ncbi:MAG: hypothetical protein EBT97_12200 [Actinobacteria bacterium]|nr:hypothetical protein [Actinomycetota bacterium]